jgi:hypothetical protein
LASKQEVKDLAIGLRQEMKALRTDIENKFVQLEHRMIIKLSAVMAAMFTLMAAFIKLT